MNSLAWTLLSIAVAALFLGFVILWVRYRVAARRRDEMIAARKSFHQRREWIEARFITEAMQSGKPRGLRWVNCDFRDDVSFARDCETGQLTALVGVTISFEAIEGGGMEEVEAVSNLRAATAVFHYEKGQWTTKGRAIMNLEPLEAIEHFRGKLVRIAE